MIVPDVNVLLYAYDSTLPQHAKAARWWEDRLNGVEPIGLPHVVLFAFVRLATSARVFAAPMALEEAAAIVRAWLGNSHVVALEGGPQHVEMTLELLQNAGATGNLVTDAQIATIAISHKATVFTNDSDFQRFPGLKVQNPLR